MSCSMLVTMLHIDIQKGKEAMKTSKFQKYVGGNTVYMKRLTMAAKGCGKLTSNDIYFADIWFSGVKTDEEVMAQRFDCCRPVKAIHKGFCLSTLEKLMKYWPGGSYLAMKITPRVSGGRPLMAIGYKYNSVIVLGFIDAKGGGSTEPRDPYLSHFPDIYFNLSVCLIFRPQLLGRYFNACNNP